MTVLAAPPLPATVGVTGRSWDPRWGWSVAGLALVTLFVTAWGVGGSMSDYYASIALSMSKSWSNFFFGAMDPAGTVTLDKIPGSFWIPALSVRVFGFSPWAVIVPNALAASASVVVVCVTARRWAGPLAGLTAGAVVATTPILVAVARSNQPETFFVLALALTAWAANKALDRRSLGWLLLAGVFIAAGFHTYMLEAWAVWPALALAYLCTRQSWARRIGHLAVAGASSLALSLVWIVAVALVPASARPYIGSTLSNNPWEMVFGYNGLGRFGEVTADDTAYRSFTPPFSGSPSALRLLNEALATQIGWMLPTAVVAVVVLFVLVPDAADRLRDRVVRHLRRHVLGCRGDAPVLHGVPRDSRGPADRHRVRPRPPPRRALGTTCATSSPATPAHWVVGAVRAGAAVTTQPPRARRSARGCGRTAPR